MNVPVKTDVLIIGGGPTGLLLACLCAQGGLSCHVLEAREVPTDHSRSIGIHPPSLNLFAQIGSVEELLAAGTRIDRGVAWIEQQRVGTIDFSTLSGAYPFILTVSQSITERILERRLVALNPDALVRGATVVGLQTHATGVDIETTAGDLWQARWAVACDGKHSFCRQALGIAGESRQYPDSYVMGDFVDPDDSRNQARIYMCRDGLVESFPHSDRLRRWVVHEGETTDIDAMEAAGLREIIRQRIGENVTGECVMQSRFQPEFFVADCFVQGRVLLAGDAAHVLSPIGGQGMNVGWLDAAAAWEAVQEGTEAALSEYAARQRALFLKAARRAEFNMARGRPFRSRRIQTLFLRLLLSPILRNHMRDRFSMQGLSE